MLWQVRSRDLGMGHSVDVNVGVGKGTLASCENAKGAELDDVAVERSVNQILSPLGKCIFKIRTSWWFSVWQIGSSSSGRIRDAKKTLVVMRLILSMNFNSLLSKPDRLQKPQQLLNTIYHINSVHKYTPYPLIASRYLPKRISAPENSSNPPLKSSSCKQIVGGDLNQCHLGTDDPVRLYHWY